MMTSLNESFEKIRALLRAYLKKLWPDSNKELIIPELRLTIHNKKLITTEEKINHKALTVSDLIDLTFQNDIEKFIKKLAEAEVILLPSLSFEGFQERAARKVIFAIHSIAPEIRTNSLYLITKTQAALKLYLDQTAWPYEGKSEAVAHEVAELYYSLVENREIIPAQLEEQISGLIDLIDREGGFSFFPTPEKQLNKNLESLLFM